MSGVVAVAILIAVVALVLARGRSSGIVRRKVTVRVPDESWAGTIEGAPDDPRVQARLRAMGIDPAELEHEIETGTTRVHTTVQISKDGKLPPGFAEHAHALSPAEAEAFAHDPELREKLRAAGVDLEQFDRDVAAGKVMGTTDSSHGFPHEPGAPPAVPQPATHAPPSEAGDDVWKKGEL